MLNDAVNQLFICEEHAKFDRQLAEVYYYRPQILDRLVDSASDAKDFKSLLDISPEMVSKNWKLEVEEFLTKPVPTPTITPIPPTNTPINIYPIPTLNLSLSNLSTSTTNSQLKQFPDLSHLRLV